MHTESRAATAAPTVLAAGGAVWRVSAGQIELAVVHRPKYGDWTFPKGKLDASDATLLDCALREVSEETGFRVEAGGRLPPTTYPVTAKGNRRADKVVHYWVMRHREGRFRANKEVDELRWVDVSDAADLLTHPHDRELVAPVRRAVDDSLGVGEAAPVPGSAPPELTHLALAIKNIDVSIRFYSGYCGLDVVHMRDDEGGRVRVAWMAEASKGTSGFVLVLAEGMSAERPFGPFAHLGFAVESRRDVDAVAERARDEGRLVLAPQDAGPIVGYICEVGDPDGNVCEFSHGQSLGRQGT